VSRAVATIDQRHLTARGPNHPAADVPLPAALAVYLDTLDGLHARRVHGQAVRELVAAVGPLPAGALTAAALTKHRAALVARTEDGAAAPLAPVAVNLRLAALRAFLSYLADAGAVGCSRDLIRRVLVDLPPGAPRLYEVPRLARSQVCRSEGLKVAGRRSATMAHGARDAGEDPRGVAGHRSTADQQLPERRCSTFGLQAPRPCPGSAPGPDRSS